MGKKLNRAVQLDCTESWAEMARTEHIFLESNIAAGKSSLMRALMERFPNWDYRPEPIEKWSDWGERHENLLEKFYLDPHRHAFEFQSAVLETFQADAIRPSSANVCVWERSPRSAIYVFARLSYERGYLTKREYNKLKVQAKTCSGIFDNPRHSTVYLRCSPEQSQARLTERSRREELCKVSLDYLSGLHRLHDELYLYGASLVIDETIYSRSVCHKVDELVQFFDYADS